MLLKIAVNTEEAQTRSFCTDPGGTEKMIGYLKSMARRVGRGKIVVAYEASCSGYGLYDRLTEAGMECHVLAPTHMPDTPKSRKSKTDEKDAQRILDVLRSHVLAGAALPAVWVPPSWTRDDRELVRGRLDARRKLSSIKTQIRSLLKRNQSRKPSHMGDWWTKECIEWLWSLVESDGFVGPGTRCALSSLLRQHQVFEEEIDTLEQSIGRLAKSERYAGCVAALRRIAGVGLMTAMVFATEVGDFKRFSNRRQLAAYFGLAPSSRESGESRDRKGHITRQGCARVRAMLCQAVWSRLRVVRKEHVFYHRLAGQRKGRKKIAVVACMRRLAVRMWHEALLADGGAQQGACCSEARSPVPQLEAGGGDE
jgi:transposase